MKWLLLSFLLLAAPAWGQSQSNPTWSINQATCGATVTPSDTTNLPAGPAPCNTYQPKGLYTAGTGAGAVCVLVMAMHDGAAITYSNIQPGLVYPFRPVAVRASGTTCVGIVVLF